MLNFKLDFHIEIRFYLNIMTMILHFVCLFCFVYFVKLSKKSVFIVRFFVYHFVLVENQPLFFVIRRVNAPELSKHIALDSIDVESIRDLQQMCMYVCFFFRIVCLTNVIWMKTVVACHNEDFGTIFFFFFALYIYYIISVNNIQSCKYE